MLGNGYIAELGDYSNSGYNLSGSNSSVKPWQNTMDTSKLGREISPLNGNNNAGMTGYQMAGAAIGAVQTIGGLWSAWEQNKLAKEQFKFNKDMATKNFALSKDAYDRQVRRSNNLTRSMQGESGESIRADQLEYNKESEERRRSI